MFEDVGVRNHGRDFDTVTVCCHNHVLHSYMKTNQLDIEFLNVPMDEGTEIRSLSMKTIGGIRCRYEKWYWDGIIAESLIFLMKDVAHLSDEDLAIMIRADDLYGVLAEDHTISRNEETGFVTFNYNFREALTIWSW